MPSPPLSIGAYGDAVARLHDTLRKNGIEVPASEVKRRFFGPATRRAVQQLQKRNHLDVTGMLDAATVSAMAAGLSWDAKGMVGSDAEDVVLIIRVLNPQGNFLGGTVDIDFQPHDVGDTQTMRNAPASADIPVPGLERFPQQAWTVTVTRKTPFEVQPTQLLHLPPSGSQTLEFTFSKGAQGQDGELIVGVVDANGNPFKGLVDITIKNLASGTTSKNTVDYSGPVTFPNLQPQGRYEVTVKPASMPDSQIQTITLPATGSATVVFTFPPPASQEFVVNGYLVFDHGLPAAGVTLRLYSVGFGGQDAKLGETNTDAQGNYSLFYSPPGAGAPNIQVRVLDLASNEVIISHTKYNAQQQETLNLVVPSSVRPLGPEFQRLAEDMAYQIGGVTNLGQAKENVNQQDLSLLNQSTSWDARLVAFAATAAQQTTATSLGQDVLYALYRVGLPTDLNHLAMVPASAIQNALTKATKAGIVNLNDAQISAATSSFQSFASQAQLAMTTPGAVSSFNELLPNLNGAKQFAQVYFSTPPAGTDLWTQAAKVGVPAPTLDALKLHGKFLYLTFNSAPLAQKLQQEIGSLANLSQIAAKDYHHSTAWSTSLKALAGSGGEKALQALIPAIYQGKTTADRLAAYSGDLARKVRFSFPTQVTARMVENKELPLKEGTAANVTAFLRAAVPLGYSLGRTPLNAFLKNSGSSLPVMDANSTESLKTLHRLFQVTPSSESLQTAMKLGFTSAYDIASYTKDEFINAYSDNFPPGEGSLVYGQAQTLSTVTFNFLSMAKQLDTAPPVYALSASDADRRSAKNAIVQQFPTMGNLFGSLDFCQCEDCRSVLSPAAYFVDVLEFLNGSAANVAGYTPLDVLIGSKNKTLPGRRPDLGALPLTCENTNTAMPYIDLVNEILEYYIANSHLDTNYAYDTGPATTADLTAEPQHILPQVYNTTLKQAVFPLNLPFDLWIETVRGFLNYFKSPLAEVLDTLRPVDNLELYTDASGHPYYRAQILAEALGLSPSEYAVLTATDSTVQPLVTNWFKLYGYPDETTALNGKVDPTDPTQYLIPPLKSAKNLSQLLGLSYQELTNLVTTGFLNPALYPLIFQFERFGINMSDAFSYTNQPGYPALTADQKTAFEKLLQGVTAQYKNRNSSSTFDAKTWLTSVLPANYSRKTLVLADPNSGCNFSGTTLQYADNATAATPLDFLKVNLFVRLWKKLRWTLEETDRALQLFFPSTLPVWTNPGFADAFTSAWKTALVYLAHLDDLNTRLAPAMGRLALLPFWASLPVQGANPLYAQLFLTPSVLNNDWAFDDPNGLFPTPASDLSPASLATFSAHLAAVQGALGLTSDEITAILADAGSTVPAAFSLANLSICYRYSELAKCLQLEASDMISLKVMSGLNPFHSLSGAKVAVLADDVLFNQTLRFVKEALAVQNSGFTVEDLNYLLRHQFDPVGKYQTDPNASMAIVQSVANGLQQIQSQNAVPPNLTSMPESPIDQSLSSLFPAPILKTLLTLLTNAQTYTASKGGVPSAIPTTPFAQETELSFSYDSTTQTQSVSFQGLLLDWKKAELKNINSSALFSGLLDAIQQQAQAVLSKSVGDILGVWASLVEYEAVQTGATTGLPVAPLRQADPAISLSYDQADQLQWLGYRGVLTDAKKNALAAVSIPPVLAPLLAALLNNVQQQALPAYSQLIGSLLAMWSNVQLFSATQGAVASTNQIDGNAFFSALTTAQQNGTITGPVPQIQFRYDSSSQIQTLTCQGVLTDSMRSQLAALVPTSTLCTILLQAVRNQALQLFQALATNLLTVAAADLDNYSKPFLGLDVSKQQKQVKAELVSVFLPLLTQKLSHQLILQTLSANLGSDPSLTEALVTDAGLLTDPSNPGHSLLGAFLSLGQQGVSASYYTSGGTAPATGTAATADTADPTNSKPGTTRAHFEGYLQVPTDGPYRFFAELGNTGAAALFRLDPPDPKALLNNPIIASSLKATKDHDEVSEFVQLKGGVLYHFMLDFSNLGANGASLLIQGETLPKGPLNQIVLYPEQAIVAFTRAKILLAKVLQILQVLDINEREISYLIANSSRFSDLRLSSLPTQPSDDSLANAIALFSQFLTLADYADLRKGPAGGTDGLIDVFDNVGAAFSEAASHDADNNLATPWKRLARLTRRDAPTVRAIGEYFGLIQNQPVVTANQVTAVGDFGNNKGIRRLWQALQLLKIVGIPLTSLTASTAIASVAPPAGSPPPDIIAANFKNAVKARYTTGSWRPIAQSVFDKLRRQKRDALVAYLVDNLALENSDQLFEYFLIDPGMEPVVQTSRLRLAMSSVQTFIQRCLLDLENGHTDQPAVNVAPSAIDADWWAWMKRYRVWQANREIFLFPENWMEPELRLDKTDLFQALESSLLQGDVTSDLVDDAFLTYLKGLEVRARLDVVAMYLDQNLTDAGISTLHVLGRTYGHPHKYFYRTYSSGTWSGWVAVTPDIESDHIVLVVWKGRLNLFWVTFITKAQAPSQPSGNTGTTPVTQLGFGDLAGNIYEAAPQKQVQVQLHWSEYFQGKWSNRISTDINKYDAINVNDSFDPSAVYIHVSKETVNGNEGAVKIHLDFWLSAVEGLEGLMVAQAAFRVTSKNCDPDLRASYVEPAPGMVYSARSIDATLYTGATTLQATFQTDIASDGTSTTDIESILQTVNNYALLTCANTVAPSFLLPQSEPLYWEAGSLVSPFFYKDTRNPGASSQPFGDELTFFVQPSLTETTIEEWEGWAIYPPGSPQNWSDYNFMNAIDIVAQVPTAGPVPVNPGDPVYSLYPMQDTTDWVANLTTAISYGGAWIGRAGGVNVGNLFSAPSVGFSSAGFADQRTPEVTTPRVSAGLTLVGKLGLTRTHLQTIKTAQEATTISSADALFRKRPARKGAN